MTNWFTAAAMRRQSRLRARQYATSQPLCRDGQELALLCSMIDRHLSRLKVDRRYARLWQRRGLLLNAGRQLRMRRLRRR